jgi:transcriptional regulator
MRADLLSHAAMYAPPAFAIHDPETLAALIARAPLATLVVAGPDGLQAAHLPLLHDPEAGPETGVLIGHLARGNPVAARGGVPALAVFAGPDAYVSPGFYASKRQHGKVVPTWDYEAVHVHGRLERFDEPEALLRVVSILTDRFEAERSAPWSVSDAPEPYIAGMLRAIVGVRLVIERVEGARKLSQNKNAADFNGVRAGLAASDRGGDRAVAALMGTIEHE